MRQGEYPALQPDLPYEDPGFFLVDDPSVAHKEKPHGIIPLQQVSLG